MLAEIPERFGVLTVPRTNFLPRPESEEGGSFADRMVVRERHSFNTTGEKPLVPKAVHRGHPEVTIENGGHRLAAPGLEPLHGWHPMETFHFPVRSYAQWEMKIRISYEARSSANLNVYSGLRAGVALLESGRLHEAYDELALDDAEVQEGVREGRLVVDRRLQRFLAGVRERVPASTGEAEPEDVDADAESALDPRHATFARAINAHGHEPVPTRRWRASRPAPRKAIGRSSACARSSPSAGGGSASASSSPWPGCAGASPGSERAAACLSRPRSPAAR